jgi:hypothetical protein
MPTHNHQSLSPPPLQFCSGAPHGCVMQVCTNIPPYVKQFFTPLLFSILCHRPSTFPPKNHSHIFVDMMPILHQKITTQ